VPTCSNAVSRTFQKTFHLFLGAGQFQIQKSDPAFGVRDFGRSSEKSGAEGGGSCSPNYSKAAGCDRTVRTRSVPSSSFLMCGTVRYPGFNDGKLPKPLDTLYSLKLMGPRAPFRQRIFEVLFTVPPTSTTIDPDREQRFRSGPSILACAQEHRAATKVCYEKALRAPQPR
jgi:hypothetical protein